MAELAKSKQLKKELNLIDVYAIATGTTLSVGFFLVPGLAAKQAGPALILSYLIGAIPLIPAMFCKMELGTAMPRAGGAYYFVDRAMGPMFGTVAGLGTWLSLILKTAFALIGMGAYLNLFIPGDYMMLIAAAFALFFGFINIRGAKESGNIQIVLVGAMLVLVFGFIFRGVFSINTEHFNNFLGAGKQSIFETAGLCYVSYIGITKVASIAEEIRDPERNLPLGMILSFFTALVAYSVGTVVMVGVLPMNQLAGSLTPVADVAKHMVGMWGVVLVTIAATCAFASSVNVGILSASRFPLAMSRDHLIPRYFRKLSKSGVPVVSVVITVALILIVLFAFNPIKIAKLASTFQLIMFALCCLAVIIMRESHIEAYDPGFKSPFYPWLHLVGIVAPFLLIYAMGTMPLVFSAGLIVLGVLWYFYYAKNRVNRGGALLHVFERLGQHRHQGLETELRGIMKEKGLREHDPFEDVVARATVIDLEHREKFDNLIIRISTLLSQKLSYPADKISQEFFEGTKVGGTPVSHGVALPHMRLHHIIEPELILVRASKGIGTELGEDFWGDHKPDGEIKAVFFLVSPEENPKQHLRLLAKIAGRVDDEYFMGEWLAAKDDQHLKNVLTQDESIIHLKIRSKSKSSICIDRMIKDIELPDGCLIALIHRDGKTIVPRGNTELNDGDRITVIGEQKAIIDFRKKYYD